MSWANDWPIALMWISVLLLIGAFFGVIRFLKNSSEQPSDRRGELPKQPFRKG